MRVERYTETMKSTWNEFVRNSDNGHFMFLRDYMDYHSDRFEDHSLLIYDENKLRALLPACERENVLHSHQGLTYGGLILNSKSYATDVKEILATVVDYAKSNDIQDLVYKCIPPVYHRQGREEDRYALWAMGAEMFRRDISSVIDLRLPFKYRSTKKQNIKKGVQAQLSIHELDDLQEYWQLLGAVLGSRHDAEPTHSYEEIQKLMLALPKHIKGYSVKHGDQLLGGALLFINHRSVHTQYLGVNPEGRDIGALDFLLDKLITHYQNEGYDYFSFGISTENAGKYLNEGLIFQKEGFGARAVMHDFYRIAVSS